MNRNYKLSQEEKINILWFAKIFFKMSHQTENELKDNNPLYLYRWADHKGNKIKVDEIHWYDFLSKTVYDNFLSSDDYKKYPEFKQYRKFYDEYQSYLKNIKNYKNIDEFFEKEIGEIGNGINYREICPFCKTRGLVWFDEHYSFCSNCVSIWTERCIEKSCDCFKGKYATIVLVESKYKDIRENSIPYVLESDDYHHHQCSKCNEEVICEDGW